MAHAFCNQIDPFLTLATKRKAARKKAPTRRRTPARKKNQNVYFFGGRKSDGDGSQKALLGG